MRAQVEKKNEAKRPRKSKTVVHYCITYNNSVQLKKAPESSVVFEIVMDDGDEPAVVGDILKQLA